MRTILLFGMVIGCLLGIGDVQAAPKPLVGVSVNVPEGGSATDLIAAVLTERTARAGVLCVSAKWSDLEPQPGVYVLKPIEDPITSMAPLGFQIAITIQTVDSNARTMPADLQDKPFDSPEVRQRFDALLGQIAPKLTDTVRTVSLGNNADTYLAAHPQELEAYAGFVEEGRTHLHALKPALPVGVTTTFDGLKTRASVLGRLNRNMDVIPVTYYPMAATFQVRPATDVGPDFDTMTTAAGTKPLLLQEMGYPADAQFGRSEEKQAGFVNAVFDALQKHQDKIGFVNFFLMYDLGDTLLDTLLKSATSPDPHFRAFLGSIGLRKKDGTPRQAWLRFEVRSAAWANQKP